MEMVTLVTISTVVHTAIIMIIYAYVCQYKKPQFGVVYVQYTVQISFNKRAT